ncbi:replication protein P [Aeromonas veronii]|uniref:replication protein P n=1 Tax=Aeromonas veronii TaxID=654 RepID=UPI003F7A8CEF
MTMKPLSAVLHEIATAPTVETITPQQRPLTDRDSKMVATLFEQLKAVFPAWKQAFPTDDHQRRALAEWTRAMVDAGCTSREQLQLGMRIARSHGGDFFPSTSKFIKWCEVTPESLGLPTLDSALVEVRTRRFTHPAVELAAKATSWERQTLSADAYRAVFDQAYAQLVRRMMAGEDLNAEVMKGLPTRAQIQHSPEFYQQTGKRAVANLKKLFKRGGDHGGQ